MNNSEKDFCVLNNECLLKKWFRRLIPFECIEESNTYDLSSRAYYSALVKFMKRMSEPRDSNFIKTNTLITDDVRDDIHRSD